MDSSMTRDDIIRMAEKAGFEIDCCSLEWHDRIEAFAALVAAHEREECAKLAERTLCACLTGHFVDPIGVWGTQVAIDIRKRGQA